MMKRYNDFCELNTAMKSRHANMPFFPPKTWTPLKYDKDIEDRRVKLHEYLQEIVNRVDMRTNPTFRAFLKVDAHLSESVTFSPLKVAELSELPQGGRDFAFNSARDLLFVATAEMKIASRLDSYITNVRFAR